WRRLLFLSGGSPRVRRHQGTLPSVALPALTPPHRRAECTPIPPRRLGRRLCHCLAVDLDRARAFLAGNHRGILATIKPDGRPQLSNILYFLDDDGRIKISVTQTRAKTHNLRRAPRAT